VSSDVDASEEGYQSHAAHYRSDGRFPVPNSVSAPRALPSAQNAADPGDQAHRVRPDLTGADVSRAALIETNLEDAILTGAKAYGISVWDVKLQNAIQTSPA
jgi:hypothetical protein